MSVILSESFLKLLEQHILSLFFITSVSSFVFAWILYNSSTAGIGRWIRLLGWFFFTFFLMYGFKILAALEPSLEFYITIINQLLSTTNNFLMFLAAKELLSGNIKIELEERKFFLASFIKQIRIYVPRSIKILAMVATLMPVFQPILEGFARENYKWLVETMLRLPDAVFSAICFIYLGLAFWVNITFLHRRWVAFAGLLPTIYYAITQVPYVFNPVFFSVDKSAQYDLVIFTASLPLKAAVFGTAYYLGCKILEVVTEIRRKIDLVINTRKNFLSHTGIIESIGKVLKANSVTLFIKMPSRSDKRVTRMKWFEKWDREKDKHELVVPLKEFPEVEEIFEKGEPESPRADLGNFYNFFPRRNAEMVSIYFPILFNGGVIGCLEVELDEYAARTSVAIYQIQRFLKGLSTAVQSYRESLSLKQATYKCATYQFEDLKNGSEAIVRITETINDILSPEGIRIFGDIGFKKKNYFISNKNHNEFLKSLNTNYIDGSDDELYESLTSEQKTELNSNNLLLRDAPLELTFEGSRPFGKMFLLIKKNRDDINAPTLGVYPMHRRAIATVISDSLVDLARDYLNKTLTDLGVELSQEPIQINQWFQAVEKAAARVEILWTVVTNPDQKDEFLGDKKNIKIVNQHWNYVVKETTQNLFSTEIGTENTSHVVTLRLETTKQTFWFGIENPNFGFELHFNSPWRNFLEHLADIADAVLFKIQARENQIENTSYHAMATMATTTGTIVHQLVNMAQSNETGFSALYEAISSEKLVAKGKTARETNQKNKLYKDLIFALKDTGEQMIGLTKAFRDITKFSEEKPCNLLRACEEAEKVFHIMLAQNEISTEIQVNPQMMLDVPFHIVSLTLANLFSNSKDALKNYDINNRLIQISAREKQNNIICSFTDNGPGIPQNFQSNLFALGKTTKPAGSGWGLYLIRRALRENGSEIELKSSEPGHTEFRITFSKAKDIKIQTIEGDLI